MSDYHAIFEWAAESIVQLRRALYLYHLRTGISITQAWQERRAFEADVERAGGDYVAYLCNAQVSPDVLDAAFLRILRGG